LVKIMMDTLAPLQSLFEAPSGQELPLPSELASRYGPLRLPPYSGRPYIIGNFVTTLDGVVSLQAPGKKGGGEISGNNRQDRFVMGILRACADAIIVGAGTLRDSPGHRWTAARVFPALALAYQQLRLALDKPEPPLNVIVSARGNVSMSLALMRDGSLPVLIVTTSQGAERIHRQQVPPWVQVVDVVGEAGSISAHAVLEVVSQVRPSQIILTEGGPQLLGNFLAERLLDELFLTLAPQIAGRDEQSEQGRRPGLVTGQLFAPAHPLWGELVSVKRGESHLFLRYRFETSV
jgi:riboflavin biosynthesis pyrimidine reductase